MQFIDLNAQYEALKDKINDRIQRVLRKGNFILGEEVRELEQKLAEYTGSSHCVTCANGTDALSLALRALDIGKNDAVFIPTFTFFATAETVALIQATPIFVDVQSDTFNIDTQDLEKKIQSVICEGKLTPKAVIAVDLFGQPADYPQIRKISDQYGLKIIEDGAQGFGGTINGKTACSFGDISTTSFFPAKPLGCYGDGGAVFTDNLNYADKIRSLRVHGKGDDKYDNVRIGYNSRLDTLQAAILLTKLEAFSDFELARRNEIAARYTYLLKSDFMVPFVPKGFTSSWAQYTLKLENRNSVQQILKDNGIPSMVYYPKCMHRQSALSEFDCYGPCPVGEELSYKVLSLPMHPYLKDEEIVYISDRIKAAKDGR